MNKIIKLFGLIEQMHIDSIFPLEPIPIPHQDLFERLEKEGYDKNLSVGLQSLDSTERILEIPPVRFHRQEIFFELYDYFKKLGSRIYFLESREHFETLAKIAREGIEIQRQLENSIDNKKELELNDYKLGVKFKYLQAIGVNDILLRNISLHNLNLVFVGEGHANWFYLHRDEIREKYGIEIEEYYRDKIVREITANDVMFAASESSGDLSMEDILKDKIEVISEKVDTNQQLELELQTLLIQRSYDAINKGRVTSGSPHFIGTWDLEVEPRGLFEMYVNWCMDHSFNGTIEDCFGSAVFMGDIYPDKLTIIKVYDTKRSIGGFKGEIIHEGVLSNGEFIGDYYMDSYSSGFKMRQLKEIEAY